MSKIVLITGGAKGIGKAIALELAQAQYDIVINYHHSKQEANKLCETIQSTYGVRSMAIQADVSDEHQVDTMITQIESTLGTVDILINNAAIDVSNIFQLKTAQEFRDVLNVNVVGAFNTSKRVYEPMRDQRYGRIVNIASTNGINTYYPMSIDYDASKAALISLTHNLAIKFAPDIHVNAVAPGFIGTESELEGYDPTFLKQECEKILVERYGEPEEVAHVVAFLVSDQANYINNTIIRVDGGQQGSV